MERTGLPCTKGEGKTCNLQKISDSEYDKKYQKTPKKEAAPFPLVSSFLTPAAAVNGVFSVS